MADMEVRAFEDPPSPESILSTFQGAKALASVLIHKIAMGAPHMLRDGKVVLTAEDFQALVGTAFCESRVFAHTGYPDNERLAVWVENMTAAPGSKLQ